MSQILRASLFAHPPYYNWYEVGMLKVSKAYTLSSIPSYYVSVLHTSTVPTVGVGKREAHKNCFRVIPEKAAPDTETTLRTAGRLPAVLSAVNAIASAWPDKLGTDPIAVDGFIFGRRRGKREELREYRPDSA